MKRIKLLIVVLMMLMLLLIQFPALGGREVPGLHKTWDILLQKHVTNGRVNYKGFAEDVKQLDSYLGTLEKVDISTFSREHKLAFWINAYNAFTVKLILNHYPVKSIREIDSPWKQRIWKAVGEILSLNDIEHKKLRKELKEPRIHFAIVCASIGCPNLQRFAFSGDRVNHQLDQAARQFFDNPKHFFIKEDGSALTIFISQIFNWFGNDFGKDKNERIAFILAYLKAPVAKKIKKAFSVKIKYLSYDWNLNEKKF